MSVILVLMRVLEFLFFVGLAGSTVVVIISFFEDAKELFEKNEPPESRNVRNESRQIGNAPSQA